jgi:hypothetical protein
MASDYRVRPYLACGGGGGGRTSLSKMPAMDPIGGRVGFSGGVPSPEGTRHDGGCFWRNERIDCCC